MLDDHAVAGTFRTGIPLLFHYISAREQEAESSRGASNKHTNDLENRQLEEILLPIYNLNDKKIRKPKRTPARTQAEARPIQANTGKQIRWIHPKPFFLSPAPCEIVSIDIAPLPAPAAILPRLPFPSRGRELRAATSHVRGAGRVRARTTAKPAPDAAWGLPAGHRH